MRQRKVKNVENRLAEYADYMIENPSLMKGKWKDSFGNDNKIFLELGCGKGQFVVAKAKTNKELNYIGAEGQQTVVLRALEKAAKEQTLNTRFMTGFIKDITEIFEEDELSGIFLNFSDPWPKDRHSKRRLTHKNFLEGFKKVSKAGSILEIKTDNEKLFEFTLGQIEMMGFEIVELTRNLHISGCDSKNITTEYEDKFKAFGKKIQFVKVALK
ncbi:MAG: tRNA (guanosine(46)-N7)-methyltransferase TrmB [Peptostreptococcaceae bacterium]|nr:tRNA (guanosine(46)-N7)-methyltransferase TrmB [Peptostreptococcaceae bacterium]